MSCGLLWIGGPDEALRTGARPAHVSSSAVQPAVGGRKLLIHQQAKILSRGHNETFPRFSHPLLLLLEKIIITYLSHIQRQI